MKYEVYRDRDSSKVGLFKGLLESEGIDVMARKWEAQILQKFLFLLYFLILQFIQKRIIIER